VIAAHAGPSSAAKPARAVRLVSRAAQQPLAVAVQASRRGALLAAVAVVAPAAALAPALAETCALETSMPSGLQFCDTVVGEGAPAEKGTIIRRGVGARHAQMTRSALQPPQLLQGALRWPPGE